MCFTDQLPVDILCFCVFSDKKAFFVVVTSDIGPQIYELVAATMVERKT